MKNSSKRLTALFLSVSVFMGLLTSCKKAKTQSKDPYADVHHNLNTPRIIQEEDAWWNSVEFSLASAELSFDMTSPDVVVQSKVLTVTDDGLYVSFIGNTFTNGEFGGTIYEVAGFSIAPGSEGKLLGEIDLNAFISSEYGFLNDICGTYEENGKTKMIFNVMNGNDLESYVCDLELEKGTIDELKKLEFPFDSSKYNVSVNTIISMNDTVFVKCSVSEKMGGSNTSCIFALKGDDWTQVRLDNIEYISSLD